MAKDELLYPVNLKINGKPCTVFGGKIEALRAIRSLLESGAIITVISRKIISEIDTLKRMKLVRWKPKSFNTGDLKNLFLVVAATQDKKTDRRITQECAKRNLLVTAQNAPENSTYTQPIIVRKGTMMFSISTSEKSPTLTTTIHRELETRYGREFARFLQFMGRIRGGVHDKIIDAAKQRELFKKLLQQDLSQLDARRNLKKFLSDIKKILNA